LGKVPQSPDSEYTTTFPENYGYERADVVRQSDPQDTFNTSASLSVSIIIK